MIFCKSKKSAKRTLENIQPVIEQRLFLKVNEEKTVVSHVKGVKFLGYTFYVYRGEGRLRVHPKSIIKMKKRIKELTNRSNGWGYKKRRTKLNEYIRGWVNYFKLADVKTFLKKFDEYYRRRIRMVYWKQWKRIRTRFRYLRKLGIDKQKAYEYASTRKGYWRIANSPILSRSLNNQKLKEIGYIFFYDYFQKITVN
jgi:hypothetical protein